ncbi:MAG: MarR family winged helix-turn-helix transcriptional regulator [Streptosporangiaceae bacterium]
MQDPRWLGEAEARAWRGYRRMCLLLDAQVARDLARDSGLSEPDYDVLSNLSESEEHRWRLSDLAARMLWSKSRLSHHITRMQQRGLVAREECVSDGRGAFVVLTDGGMRAIEAAAPDHVESVRRHLIDLLSEEQIDVLGDIAGTVVRHLANIADNGREDPTDPGRSSMEE